jgi:hypothetical protein
MKKFLIPALCFCASLSLAACSAPSETDDEERGGIEQFNKEVARDATNTIKRPLDKAHGVEDIARQHNKDIPQE